MKRSVILIGVLLCVLAACIGGGYAQWVLADVVANPEKTDNGIEISPFYYKPQEVLPDEEESTELRENHMDLLNNILYHSKYGLNYSNTLDNAVERYGTLRSQENISGGNLKHLFTTRASELLDFALQYVSDTEFVLYTFEDDALETGIVGSTRIPVYKIVIRLENGTWSAVGAVEGHALIRQFTTSNNKKYRTVNPEDFIVGPLSKYEI